MSEELEKEFERKDFYGQRLGGLKVHRTGERHPKTGQRFFHHRPDGSFVNQNTEKEDEKEMQLDQKELNETLRRIQSGDFEFRVAKLREQGVALADAIAKVAAEFPEKHEDYLRRAQVGQADPLK